MDEKNMDANPPVDKEFEDAEDLIRSQKAELDPTEDVLKTFFTYHPPTDEDVIHYKAVNDAALAFARVIMDHVPSSPDRTVAIRRVREARMDANAAIACRGARSPY